MKISQIFGYSMATALVLFLVVFCPACWQIAQQRQARLDEAMRALPLKMSVDFSKTAITKGSLDKQHHSSHGMEFELLATPAFTSAAEAKAAVDALDFKIVVNDAQQSSTFDKSNVQYQTTSLLREHKTAFGIYLPGLNLNNGTHDVTVQVDRATDAFAGRAQTLVARYKFCPCELTSIAIPKYLALGLGFVGLVSGSAFLVGLIKRRKPSVQPAA